jgi:hypothetical protein
MGDGMFDQYSLLHVAVAILAYFWQVPLWVGLVAHTAFELFENSAWGVWAINRWFVGAGPLSWPGRKDSTDTWMNQVGDTVSFVAGWLLAAWLDSVGTAQGWHRKSVVPK